MKKSVLLWILAIVLTLSSIVYQRLTGPTHPVRGSVKIAGESISYKLVRSHDTTHDAEIAIKATNPGITGKIKYRRYKSHDEWHTVDMERSGDMLTFGISKQPMAGKVMYSVLLFGPDGAEYNLTDESIIMRFKDPVPSYVLGPHIAFMLMWMLVSTRTGLQALTRGEGQFGYTLITTILLIVGGLILGPIVQKFAFNDYWTGWPWGHDLTDNKTAIAFVFWAIALWRAKKGSGRPCIIAAAIMTFAVYLIPHSVLGSELDYTKIESAGN